MFELNEEQKGFRDTVRRYLEKEYDFSSRKKILEDGGYSPEHWRTFAQLGWIAAVVDEEDGGLGNANVHAQILMEAFGRHLVLEPLLWTGIVCGRLLSASRMPVERRRQLIADIIDGKLHLALAQVEQDGDPDTRGLSSRIEAREDGFVLCGRKPVVPNGGIADKFIVVARHGDDLALVLVDRQAPGVQIHSFRTHDGQTAADVSFRNAKINRDDVLATGPMAQDILEEAMDRGTAALCADAVGSMTYLVQATADYLKHREQYGQPLASFQVLQHRLADMYVECETARSIASAANAAADADPTLQAHLVSAAKVQVFRAANFVGKQAVQLHGGMGVSEEMDIAHHFKRLTMAALQFRDEGFHIRRFAQTANGRSPGHVDALAAPD